MEKIRYFNRNKGPIKENELRVISKAVEICNQIADIEEVIMLIHTKSNTGYFQRIFDISNTNQFFSGVKIHQELPIFKAETIRTFNDFGRTKRLLIAFGLRSEELFKYDSYYSVVAIIAHQWNDPEVIEWASAWGAIDIETNEPIDKGNLPDIVVQNAFKDLTNSINMSTGINHHMDNEQCKTYLRALHKYNYELNPSQIRSYLISELNWDSDYVQDVIDLIDKLNAGSYFKGGSKTGLQHYIKEWRKDT